MLGASTPVIAQPANDECAGALVVFAGIPVSDNTSTNGATATTSPTWGCGAGATNGLDVWYYYDALASGTTVYSLCTSAFDTRLQVFTGICGNLTSIGCNDDFASCSNTAASRLSLTATAGVRYYVRVGGYNAAVGAFTLEVTAPSPPPANDECSGAIALVDATPVTASNTTATATTTPTWTCGGGTTNGLDLWYYYDALGTGSATFSLCGSALSDTRLAVYTGTCGALSLVACNDDSCGVRSQIVTPVTLGTRYYVRSAGYGAGAGSLATVVTGPPPPIVCPMNDAAEPNDTCASPSAAAPGTTTSLTVKDSNVDFYAFTLDALASSTITVDFSHATADVNLEVYTAGCGALVGLSLGTTDSESITVYNTSGSAQSYVARVFLGSGTCNEYSLTRTDIACGASADDAYEQNDTCATASAIPLGATPGLRVVAGDLDCYSFSVADGMQVLADVLFTHAQGDLDIYLHNITNGSCGGTTTGSLAAGTGIANNESVTWTNTTGSTQNLILVVRRFSGSGCHQTYELVLSIVVPTGIGTTSCAAATNSTGAAAHTVATGSNNALDDDVTLTCSGMPPSTFGYFINSRFGSLLGHPAVTTQVSDGVLCLVGGTFGRHLPPQQADGSGSFALTLDLPSLPHPDGLGGYSVPVLNGQTWYWQCWYRDAGSGAARNNFSTAVRVVFAP